MRYDLRLLATVCSLAVAVKVLGAAPVPTPGAVPADTSKQSEEPQLVQRVQNADAIVVGRVIAVRRATMKQVPGGRVRISEHDPKWSEAVIEVEPEGLLQGPQSAKARVVVHFPASNDVRWRYRHKFREGESGTFLLQSDKETTGRLELRRQDATRYYTAGGQEDILPIDAAPRIRELAKR